MRRILFLFLIVSSINSFACHNCAINGVNYVNNGNNTTTFTIDLTVDVGTLDGYSYGFGLVFSNTTATQPIVLSSPSYTANLTRAGYNDLVGYTGTAIGSGLGAANTSNYFDDRYGNRTDVLTYETDDDWFGFGATDYTKTVVVTLQGCVESIMLDGDFRSTGSATALGAAACTVTHNTGISCLVSCGTCSTPNCLIAGPYTNYNDASVFSNHCSQMNDLSSSPITASTYITYHSLTASSSGTVGMVISLQEGGPTSPCGITKVAKLYPSGSSCSAASAISPTTTTANGSTFYNPEWTGLTANATYIVEITFTIPSGCSLIDHCESFYHPAPSCSADVGNITVTGGVAVGTNEYDLTNCQTITLTAANEDLNGGTLTYGWAIFNCQPTLPFSAAQISDFNNHTCYLGSDYGLTTNDQDAGGVSGTIPGGYSTLWILPYTSDGADALDSNGDGCYDLGDLIKINYLPPTCGDCSNPTCSIGGVNEFADRTYLSCDDPCADLNNITHVTYHTVTTDLFGNVGVVQQISFSQFTCSSLSRSAVLRDASNSCNGPDISPNVTNANGVGSGFNPEWNGLSPNTNYTLILTTVIGANCDYDFGCVDFYGIPTCNTVYANLDTTVCNGGSISVNGTIYNGSNTTGQETFTTMAGCDSIVTVTLTELAVITHSITPTICSNSTYLYDGVTYDANNTTGTHVFTSAFGCDSTVSINVNVQNTLTSTLDTTVCNGVSIVVNGTTYNGANPTGQETFTLLGGCDSIVTINLTELNPIVNTITPTICANGSYQYDGTTYDTSNTTGTHTFTSAYGCDSTVTIALNIQNVITNDFSATLCYGDSVVINSHIYNGANPTGQEIFTLPSGCDSVVNITITELNIDTSYLDTVLYVGQSLDISGVVLIESDFSGLVYLQGIAGCDSIVSVNVTMLYEYTYYVPSGFSPNGDGQNDFIGVMGGGIEEMNFNIFNRWGEVVFNSECCCSQACSWDGTYRSQSLNVGTFVYYLTGKYINGIEFREKGTISLVK